MYKHTYVKLAKCNCGDKLFHQLDIHM